MSKKVKDYKNEEWAKAKLPSPHLTKTYYYSNRGRLKSRDKKTGDEFLMKMNKDKHGHLRASIKLANKKNYAFWIHKHMAKSFVDKPSRKHTLVIHKNYDRADNKLRNLVWATPDEHKKYIQERLKALGFEHHRRGGVRKLTEKKVATIKKMLRTGRKKRYQIAEKYGVSVTQLKRIERGENWGHVEEAK
jgi:hypothetical protein